jgi:hypothetical protein
MKVILGESRRAVWPDIKSDVAAAKKDAFLFGKLAKQAELIFKSLRHERYLTDEVLSQLRTLVNYRCQAAQKYIEVGECQGAFYQYSCAARHLYEYVSVCIEERQGRGKNRGAVFSPTDLLLEAAACRTQAIRLCRRMPENEATLAAELSYKSKLLMFMRNEFKLFRNPQIFNELTAARREAARLFDRLGDHRNACYQYDYLMHLYVEAAIESNDHRLLADALICAENVKRTYGLAGLNELRFVRSMYTAKEGCKTLAQGKEKNRYLRLAEEFKQIELQLKSKG